MVDLSEYVFEELRKDEEFILYRGQSKGVPSQVLLLLPFAEYPKADRLKRLENEYSFKEAAQSNTGGQPMEIALALRLAISISAAVGAFHQRGIIDKDIKPANILADSTTGQCWLTDYGERQTRVEY